MARTQILSHRGEVKPDLTMQVCGQFCSALSVRLTTQHQDVAERKTCSQRGKGSRLGKSFRTLCNQRMACHPGKGKTTPRKGRNKGSALPSAWDEQPLVTCCVQPANPHPRHQTWRWGELSALSARQGGNPKSRHSLTSHQAGLTSLPQGLSPLREGPTQRALRGSKDPGRGQGTAQPHACDTGSAQHRFTPSNATQQAPNPPSCAHQGRGDPGVTPELPRSCREGRAC